MRKSTRLTRRWTRLCFRPLSRGLFFNDEGGLHSFLRYGVFVPFLGDLFSIPFRSRSSGVSSEDVFVPFLGNFFQSEKDGATLYTAQFSSPFLGTFLQSDYEWRERKEVRRFSSPFSGTFFQLSTKDEVYRQAVVFVPSLGDFFSIWRRDETKHDTKKFSSPLSGTFFQFSSECIMTAPLCFRPLSRGLFFNPCLSNVS